MTEFNPAYTLNSEDHTAAGFRRMIAALCAGQNGVILAASLAVTEKSGTPDMSVDVAGGWAVVDGSEGTYQGSYLVDNQGVTNLAITAADATNPRIDRVVAKVEDAEYSGATSAWSLAVVTGTPAGSPSAPAEPSNAITLATVAVAALASSIVDANITDSRDVIHDGVSLDSRVTTNASGIATNVSNIATNVTDIATNVSNISSNDSDISALQTKTGALTRSGGVSEFQDTTFTADCTNIYLEANAGLIGSGTASATDWLLRGSNTAMRFGRGDGTLAMGLNSSAEFFAKLATSASSTQTVRIASSGSYSKLQEITSSKRWKQDIEEIAAEDSASIIRKLRPVTFDSVLFDDRDEPVQTGFIAEQAAATSEDLAQPDLKEPGEWQGINTTAILAHLVTAWQDLDSRVAELAGGDGHDDEREAFRDLYKDHKPSFKLTKKEIQALEAQESLETAPVAPGHLKAAKEADAQKAKKVKG